VSDKRSSFLPTNSGQRKKAVGGNQPI